MNIFHGDFLYAYIYCNSANSPSLQFYIITINADILQIQISAISDITIIVNLSSCIYEHCCTIGASLDIWIFDIQIFHCQLIIFSKKSRTFITRQWR